MESPAKILIIEDDPTIALDLSMILRRAGHQVIGPEADYDSGIKAVKKHDLDLVLLDIELSGEQGGIDVAHFINDYASVPFIYISSYTTADILHAAAETSPLTYIVKPFRANDVKIAVQMALSQKSEKKLPSLDYINKKAPISLTKSEYKTMVALLRGLSGKQIADEHYVSLHTVKTHLKRLYSKMEVHSKMELQEKVMGL